MRSAGIGARAPKTRLFVAEVLGSFSPIPRVVVADEEPPRQVRRLRSETDTSGGGRLIVDMSSRPTNLAIILCILLSIGSCTGEMGGHVEGFDDGDIEVW